MVGGCRAERPKTLRRLRNVYEQMNSNDSKRSQEDPTSSATSADKTLAILSPFDEQEEWAKISEIMASFGTGLVRESVFVTELEKEFQARLGLNRSESGSSIMSINTTVGQWLTSLSLSDYESLFLNSGYDDLDFLNGILDESDLIEMGIGNEKDRSTILESCKTLACKIRDAYTPTNNNNNDEKGNAPEGNPVDDWLRRLHLDAYIDTFQRHLYTDMDRVQRIWEVELTAVLEISKPGHRKRMLASLPTSGREKQPVVNLEDVNADLSQLKNNIQQLKDEIRVKLPQSQNKDNVQTTPGSTGTLRHSHKKSRPAPPPPPLAVAQSDIEIRDPSELLVGVPATLTTQWRHRPHTLVTGAISYVASYLGSTVVKELRGTESTKKSIQKMKKSTASENKGKSTPEIVLVISFRGVKFLNPANQELICEHEIRNIHCACQDAEDLTHFAYITKDHTTKSHYCHVFCVQTMDQATEVILTLGQAFEVAYQMALREGYNLSSKTNSNGHTRSRSANQIMNQPVVLPVTEQPQANHSRSHSVNEIKVNGTTSPQKSQDSVSNGLATTPSGRAPIVLTDDI
uniref:PID domain-containing protein n=1 Tax=Clastoptera arizonana TaxID=38151 RepID=A0A1B6EDU6_9HEMI